MVYLHTHAIRILIGKQAHSQIESTTERTQESSALISHLRARVPWTQHILHPYSIVCTHTHTFILTYTGGFCEKIISICKQNGLELIVI